MNVKLLKLRVRFNIERSEEVGLEEEKEKFYARIEFRDFEDSISLCSSDLNVANLISCESFF
jgi:hypothetical protein